MSNLRYGASARTVVVALAGVVACGGSSRRTPVQEGAGSGGITSGGRGNQGPTGGTASPAAGGRPGPAGGRGGAAGAAGGSGAAAGQETGAAAGIGGGAGAPEEQGGAAGASAGWAGTGGAPSAAFAPPWLPTGAFGVAAQHVVDAATEYTFWLCATNNLEVDRCTRAELHNFAPSLEWLACASRVPGADALLEELASGFFACATEHRSCGCGIVLCDVTLPDLPGCPSYQSHACPDGGTFAYRCDEGSSVSCGDGYDQRNCDPAASRYDCGDGGFIAWTAVCDGSPDCANEVDEFRCAAPGGEGGAAG